MLVLTIEKEVEDCSHYDIDFEYMDINKNILKVTRNTYESKRFQLSDGSIKMVVAGDSVADELLNLLIRQGNEIRDCCVKLRSLGLISQSELNQKITYVSNEIIELKKIELAKERLSNLDNDTVKLLKDTYNSNVELGGSLSKYKDFFDCFMNYFMTNE